MSNRTVTRALYANKVITLKDYSGGSGISLGKTDEVSEAVSTGNVGATDPNSHTHINKPLLDSLGLDTSLLLYHNNNLINIPLLQEDW